MCCKNCDYRFDVASNAKTRQDLAHIFYLTCSYCHTTLQYTPIDVCAESSEINPAGGALIGGLVGLVGSAISAVSGGIGVIVGALAGAAISNSSREKDEQAVRRFNSS